MCILHYNKHNILATQAKDAKQQLSTRRQVSAAARGKGSGPPPPRRNRGRGGVSLGLLLEEGLLLPGTGVLSVDYKQRRTLADLCGDGRIKCACASSDSHHHPKTSRRSTLLCCRCSPSTILSSAGVAQAAGMRCMPVQSNARGFSSHEAA